MTFSPRRFGAYWLVEHLGEGGMGAVYLARREGIAGADRLCVVKTLRGDYKKNSEHIARFTDEARLATRLNHQNICAVFDVGRVGDEHYLAMDVVNGVDVGTLFHRLHERRKVLPAPVALYLGCEILEALDYAHRLTDPVTGRSLQIVHRDVSPHNAMVTFEGEVKLIDFGLARSTMRDDFAGTAANLVVGKLKYMAPEQAKAEAIDARADQFALAVILTELVTGERFYDGVDEARLAGLILWGSHRPKSFAKIAPPQLRAILERALSPSAPARFPSCRAMLEALDTLPERREPGASRALRAILDAELDDEKRALRARLALGSGRLGQAPIDVNAATVVKSVPGFGLADVATREQRDDDATEVVSPVVLQETTELGPTTDSLPMPKALVEALTVRARPPSPPPSSPPSSPRSPPPSPPSPPPSPPAVARAASSPAATSAPPPATSAPPPATSAPPPALTHASALAPVVLETVNERRPHREPSSSSALTGAVAELALDPPRRPLALALTFAVVFVVVLALAYGVKRLWFTPHAPPVAELPTPTPTPPPPPPTPTTTPDIDVAIEPLAPTAPATTAPKKATVVSSVPAPPKSGNLKDTLDYLDKNCRKRVKCAQPLVDKRSQLASMAAPEIMKTVEDAEACAKKCAR